MKKPDKMDAGQYREWIVQNNLQYFSGTANTEQADEAMEHITHLAGMTGFNPEKVDQDLHEDYWNNEQANEGPYGRIT